MKRLLLFSFFLIQVISLRAQKPYVIKGAFKCKYQGKVYLYHGTDKDSLYTRNGSFMFKGAVDLPVESFISIESKFPVGGSPFYIEGGAISVVVDTITSILDTAKGDRISLDVKVKLDRQSVTDRLLDSVNLVLNNAKKASLNADGYSGLARQHVHAFLSSHPNTIAATVLFSHHKRFFSTEELMAFYKGLSPGMKATEAGKYIHGATIKKLNVSVGSIIPDFSQNNTVGKSISILSLRGKYVLIDFWASWCMPCRQENPTVFKAYRQYKNKGFEVLGVSLDDKKKNWLQAIKADGLAWIQVSDLNGWNNEVAKSFDIKSIPDNILIDPTGKVLARGLNGDALEKKLSEIFLEKKTD